MVLRTGYLFDQFGISWFFLSIRLYSQLYMHKGARTFKVVVHLRFASPICIFVVVCWLKNDCLVLILWFELYLLVVCLHCTELGLYSSYLLPIKLTDCTSQVWPMMQVLNFLSSKGDEVQSKLASLG